MVNLSRCSFVSAALMVVGLSASVSSPLMTAAPVVAQANFSDVPANYWASPFIERLAQRDIIKGFPDGSFQPDQPVTRAQFAAIVRNAFNQQSVRQYVGFTDVPRGHWAEPAIQESFTTGFLSGYPNNIFQPNQQIPRAQALVSLASGLQLAPQGNVERVLQPYRDAMTIPDYAKSGIAAATQRGLVVNYPTLNALNPNQIATRADIAAFVHQALVNQGVLQSLDSNQAASNFIVRNNGGQVSDPQLIATGTKIPLTYPGGSSTKLVIAPGETVATTLEVAANVTNSQGDILIPKGSRIEGRLVPVTINTSPGAQFMADRMTIGDRTYTTLRASSDPVVATSQQSLSPQTLRGSLVTVAAQTALSRLLGGGLNLGSLLTGVLQNTGRAPSAPTSGQTNVIVVDPAALVLTLQSDLRLAAQSRVEQTSFELENDIKALW